MTWGRLVILIGSGGTRDEALPDSLLGLRSLVLVGQARPEQVDRLVFLLPVLAAMTGPWEFHEAEAKHQAASQASKHTAQFVKSSYAD